MPSLKEVRNRLVSVKSTQQITKAMKMVAAAKLRKAQNSILQMRPYAKKLDAVLQNVTSSLADEDFASEFAVQRPVKKVLLVPVTSDKGLCGAFNTNIIKATNSLINGTFSQHAQAGNLHILSIGKKGMEYFKRRNYHVIDDFTGLFASKDISFDAVKKAAEYAMNGFSQGEYDAVYIIYNEFKNVATQFVRTEQFLPLSKNEETKKGASTDYLFEPSTVSIVENLIPKSLKIQFYKAVLESNASEQGSRMTAMDKATENAGDLIKELQLTYNRARQANITKEILEIVGGAEALSQA